VRQATNAFVKTFYRAELEVPLLYVKDFPKAASSLNLDFSSLLGPLFYMWILQLLFPVRQHSNSTCSLLCLSVGEAAESLSRIVQTVQCSQCSTVECFPLPLCEVSMASLVYEKEKNLRMMMRMHGLGDGAYWLIS